MSEKSTPGGNVLRLEVQDILSLLPHRYPFLLVDRILELVPGERALAHKCVSANEPFFQGHFPDHPIMPGVLICEVFAQVAALIAVHARPDYLNQSVLLMGLDRMRFRRPVTPGDLLVVEVETLTCRRDIWRFRCLARVGEERAASGELLATVRSIES